MAKKKKREKVVGAIELHYPTLIHWCLLIASIFLIFLVLKLNYQATASSVADICRTLLALNGTLLALVVGFSAFYFAVVDARRIQASQPTTYDWFNELKQVAAPLTIRSYREKMRAVAILLASVALTYGAILGVTFALYLFSLSQSSTAVIAQPSLWVLALYFVVLSPIVTVADPAIMTWCLTNDVAGSTKYRCPYCNQKFDEMEAQVKHEKECPKKAELQKDLESSDP